MFAFFLTLVTRGLLSFVLFILRLNYKPRLHHRRPGRGWLGLHPRASVAAAGRGREASGGLRRLRPGTSGPVGGPAGSTAPLTFEAAGTLPGSPTRGARSAAPAPCPAPRCPRRPSLSHPAGPCPRGPRCRPPSALSACPPLSMAPHTGPRWPPTLRPRDRGERGGSPRTRENTQTPPPRQEKTGKSARDAAPPCGRRGRAARVPRAPPSVPPEGQGGVPASAATRRTPRERLRRLASPL